MFDIINIPFAYVLRFIADICGNSFPAAVFIFTLVINLAFIPLTIKSQKSSVQQMRIKPKLDALKEKCGDDRQKYTQEMQALYQKEGVSMGGGCLPMIFRLVILMSIYWLIMSPVTYLAGAEKTKVENVNKTISTTLAKDKYSDLAKDLGWTDKNANNQLGIVKIIRDQEKLDLLEEKFPAKEYKKIKKDLSYIVEKDKETYIDYNLFGLELTEQPEFGINVAKAWRTSWIMPLIAFAAQILSSLMTMAQQRKQNPDAPNMMGMMLTMPLISLFIGFTLPCGVTFYWACSSIIGGVIQVFVQQFYGPQKLLAKERTKELVKQCDFENTQFAKFGDATK